MMLVPERMASRGSVTPADYPKSFLAQRGISILCRLRLRFLAGFAVPTMVQISA